MDDDEDGTALLAVVTVDDAVPAVDIDDAASTLDDDDARAAPPAAGPDISAMSVECAVRWSAAAAKP